MPSPIARQSSSPASVSHPQPSAEQTHTASANDSQRAAHQSPGNGIMRVSGHPVPMTAMNTAGFTSSFPTRNTAMMAQRQRLGISPQRAGHLLNQREALAAEARRAIAHIAASQLNNFPQAKQHLDQSSQRYFHQVPAQYTHNISETLDDYQGTYGDNVLMNVSAMGYQDIHAWLTAVDPRFHDESEVDDFMTTFGHHYSAFTGMDDEEEELHDLKTRLDDRLQEPTQQLTRYLHNAPRMTGGVPLIKGATGGDNPITTQLDGNRLLGSVLQGNALNFNGFLSTSSQFSSALEFSGKMPSTVLGEPHYVVDLTKNDEKNEILRRHMLRELQQGNVDTGSLLFLFKASNAAGVSVNATRQAASPEGDAHRLSGEDEILLAPGHFFTPEHVVRAEDGIALMGSLQYGR